MAVVEQVMRIRRRNIFVMLAVLIVITPIFLLIYGVISTVSSLRAGVVEPAGHLAVLHTDWIAEAWVTTYGWRGENGTEEIIARNSVTGQKVILATARNLWPSSFESPSDGTLVIVTPNQTDLVETHAPVDGVRVQFRYTPYDDPAFRKGFADWFNDPRNPRNKEWYCNSWFPRLPLNQQKERNSSLGRQFLAGGGNYCEEN